MGYPENENGITQSTPSSIWDSHLPPDSHKLSFLSLRFLSRDMEEGYAEMVQTQAARQLWWSTTILGACLLVEMTITIVWSASFDPSKHPAHLAYIIGTVLLVISCGVVSYLSRRPYFIPYTELVIACGSSIMVIFLCFFSDHYRVASIVEQTDPSLVWESEEFSDAPLLLGLVGIVLSVCVFLPVRCAVLWPISLSTFFTFTSTTIICGAPDGSRPSIINILMLAVVLWVAFCGRRALETNLRLQFMKFHEVKEQIGDLESKINDLRNEVRILSDEDEENCNNEHDEDFFNNLNIEDDEDNGIIIDRSIRGTVQSPHRSPTRRCRGSVSANSQSMNANASRPSTKIERIFTILRLAERRIDSMARLLFSKSSSVILLNSQGPPNNGNNVSASVFPTITNSTNASHSNLSISIGQDELLLLGALLKESAEAVGRARSQLSRLDSLMEVNIQDIFSYSQLNNYSNQSASLNNIIQGNFNNNNNIKSQTNQNQKPIPSNIPEENRSSPSHTSPPLSPPPISVNNKISKSINDNLPSISISSPKNNNNISHDSVTNSANASKNVRDSHRLLNSPHPSKRPKSPSNSSSDPSILPPATNERQKSRGAIFSHLTEATRSFIASNFTRLLVEQPINDRVAFGARSQLKTQNSLYDEEQSEEEMLNQQVDELDALNKRRLNDNNNADALNDSPTNTKRNQQQENILNNNNNNRLDCPSSPPVSSAMPSPPRKSVSIFPPVHEINNKNNGNFDGLCVYNQGKNIDFQQLEEDDDEFIAKFILNNFDNDDDKNLQTTTVDKNNSDAGKTFNGKYEDNNNVNNINNNNTINMLEDKSETAAIKIKESSKSLSFPTNIKTQNCPSVHFDLLQASGAPSNLPNANLPQNSTLIGSSSFFIQTPFGALSAVSSHISATNPFHLVRGGAKGHAMQASNNCGSQTVTPSNSSSNSQAQPSPFLSLKERTELVERRKQVVRLSHKLIASSTSSYLSSLQQQKTQDASLHIHNIRKDDDGAATNSAVIDNAESEWIQTLIPTSLIHNNNEKVLANLLLSLGSDWSVPMFSISELSGSSPIILVGSTLFSERVAGSNLITNFLKFNNSNQVKNTSALVPLAFLTSIEQEYLQNTYHNQQHGAEVGHGTVTLLRYLGVWDTLNSADRLSIIIASLCHDVSHPGVNNGFMVNTEDALAITYNDTSVLENFHAATTFRVLQRQGCRMLKYLSISDKATTRLIRKSIIELILETDMSRHFESLSKFKIRAASAPMDFNPSSSREDAWLVARMAIKAADIGHSAKPWAQHYTYSLCVAEEFFMQGDMEKRLGLPISPLCDRSKGAELAKSQVGFLGFVCRDLFVELASVEGRLACNQRLTLVRGYLCRLKGVELALWNVLQASLSAQYAPVRCLSQNNGTLTSSNSLKPSKSQSPPNHIGAPSEKREHRVASLVASALSGLTRHSVSSANTCSFCETACSFGSSVSVGVSASTPSLPFPPTRHPPPSQSILSGKSSKRQQVHHALRTFQAVHKKLYPSTHKSSPNVVSRMQTSPLPLFSLIGLAIPQMRQKVNFLMSLLDPRTSESSMYEDELSLCLSVILAVSCFHHTHMHMHYLPSQCFLLSSLPPSFQKIINQPHPPKMNSNIFARSSNHHSLPNNNYTNSGNNIFQTNNSDLIPPIPSNGVANLFHKLFPSTQPPTNSHNHQQQISNFNINNNNINNNHNNGFVSIHQVLKDAVQMTDSACPFHKLILHTVAYFSFEQQQQQQPHSFSAHPSSIASNNNNQQFSCHRLPNISQNPTLNISPTSRMEAGVILTPQQEEKNKEEEEEEFLHRILTNFNGDRSEFDAFGQLMTAIFQTRMKSNKLHNRTPSNRTLLAADITCNFGVSDTSAHHAASNKAKNEGRQQQQHWLVEPEILMHTSSQSTALNWAKSCWQVFPRLVFLNISGLNKAECEVHLGVASVSDSKKRTLRNEWLAPIVTSIEADNEEHAPDPFLNAADQSEGEAEDELEDENCEEEHQNIDDEDILTIMRIPDFFSFLDSKCNARTANGSDPTQQQPQSASNNVSQTNASSFMSDPLKLHSLLSLLHAPLLSDLLPPVSLAPHVRTALAALSCLPSSLILPPVRVSRRPLPSHVTPHSSQSSIPLLKLKCLEELDRNRSCWEILARTTISSGSSDQEAEMETRIKSRHSEFDSILKEGFKNIQAFKSFSSYEDFQGGDKSHLDQNDFDFMSDLKDLKKINRITNGDRIKLIIQMHLSNNDHYNTDFISQSSNLFQHHNQNANQINHSVAEGSSSPHLLDNNIYNNNQNVKTILARRQSRHSTRRSSLRSVLILPFPSDSENENHNENQRKVRIQNDKKKNNHKNLNAQVDRIAIDEDENNLYDKSIKDEQGANEGKSKAIDELKSIFKLMKSM